MQTSTQPIFALDIGTRSIVGILAYPKNDQLEVVDCEVFEHRERSMLDGQIHDVIKVAEIISQIKNNLEMRNNIQLKSVSVAAAGRSLKTIRTKVDRSIKEQPFGTRDEVVAFELEAVQQAQRILMAEMEGVDKTKFHCVGYSVVEYFIDGNSIGSIIDQYGEIASIDVIATFLPRVVIDSLQASLTRAGLEISSITLEPIAAINVLIPSTMRKLNIALVDIGAGTSDIALTAEGTITAYAMVPIAGDEITEALSQKYLLDFNVAEKIKRSLQQERVSYQDILGFTYEKDSKEIILSIKASIEKLAKQISEKILEYNKQSPQAVMLIGGGSMTPMLTNILSDYLQLPKERVAVRGAEAIQNIIGDHDILKGPEAVTPVGIAMAALSNHVSYINTQVNNKQIKVFDFKKLLVGDALIAAGIDMHKMHGKPGMAISVEVNGQLRIIRGEHGTPAKVFVNGVTATLETSIKDGDIIKTENGTNGGDAFGIISDILTGDEQLPISITLNNQKIELPILLYKNGKNAQVDDVLNDRDQIIVHPPSTIKECLTACGIDDINLSESVITFYINDQPKTYSCNASEILLNNQSAAMYTRIKANDVIEIKRSCQQDLILKNVIDHKYLFGYEVTVTVNEQPVTLQNPSTKILVNGQQADLETIINDQDRIDITSANQLNIIFNDIFNYIDIMAKKPTDATRLEMILNDETAAFDTPLKNGDIITLTWH